MKIGAQPTPIKIWPMIAAWYPGVNTISAAPAAPQAIIAAIGKRTPHLSNDIPTGICRIEKDAKTPMRASRTVAATGPVQR